MTTSLYAAIVYVWRLLFSQFLMLSSSTLSSLTQFFAFGLVNSMLCSCSSAGVADTIAESLRAATTASAPAPRTRADSLNGVQGHAFGEPLRNFPGLILLEKHDEEGVRWYRMPAGREHGWVCRVPDYLLSISRRPVFHV